MNITHGLRRALQINPLGIAVLEGERKLTWAEVGERVSRLAGALRQRGVSKGDRVAVLMLNGGRYLELYLAVGWAGAVIVPLVKAQRSAWRTATNFAVIAPSGFPRVLAAGECPRQRHDPRGYQGHPCAFGYNTQATRRPSLSNRRYAFAQPRKLPYCTGHQTLSASLAPRPEPIHTLHFSVGSNWTIDPSSSLSFGAAKTSGACGSAYLRRCKSLKSRY
jgi:non-ribosomal peptide synthetase component F